MRKQSFQLQLYTKQSLLNFYLQAKQKYKENDSLSLMICSTDTIIYRSKRNKYKAKLPCNKSTWTMLTVRVIIKKKKNFIYLFACLFLQYMRLVVSILQDTPAKQRQFSTSLEGLAMIMKQKKNNKFCLLDAQLDCK